MAARIQYRHDGSADVRFTFDRSVIDHIKLTVPASHRAYDPGARSWHIRPSYVPDVLTLLRRHYPGAVEVVNAPGRDRWEPTPIHPTDRALLLLHLQPSAPDGLVEAAYRYLARQAHPDAGGNDEAMRRLNAAVETLRQRRVAS